MEGTETVASGIAANRTLDLKLDLALRLADFDTKLKNYQRLVDRGALLDQFLAVAGI